ncbi:MlaE family ABC transporter permease [Rhodococcus qingshengii]|uniref:MlaE family ABC transporter permease n=1 Tax=Rhodococcus qingshengii TaxID=334542 RepID=UPI0036DB18FD
MIEVSLSDSLAQIGKFGRTRARVARTSRSIDDVGRQAVFFARAIAHIPWAIRKHPKEVLRLVAEISMGTGALAVIGGTVAVVGFLTLASGGTIAIQGFSSLGNIGVEALTGFFSAFINVRIAAPVIAGIGLSATIGAGSTAQIGAMRISEEIDALESMAISSVPYVVSTRVTAGMIAILPLYSLALVGSFLAGRFTTVVLFGQSSGLYDHYFTTFLDPVDVAWSFVQVLVMALLVMLIHTYYGYNASGGPSGVGTAVGRGVRLSLICVVAVTLLVSLALYGGSGNFNLSG